jgi:hypothetical protein
MLGTGCEEKEKHLAQCLIHSVCGVAARREGIQCEQRSRVSCMEARSARCCAYFGGLRE